MHSICSRLAGILALAAAIAAAPRAQAQSAEPRGFFVGIGGGVSFVDEPRANSSHVGESVHLRAGWRLGPSTALMLEGSMHGLGSTAPDSALSGIPDTPAYDHFTRTLETESLLASVQFGSASFYVRPGVGVARHAFKVLRPLATDVVIEATSRETVPAAALTVGRRVAIPGLPLNVEGALGWSGGEDSTHPRWAAGVQIARVIHF
ncbi:MAG TPA: hypothetical protein VGO40_24860 [Longimicrobium sp.]|jgi:hypothetical protein|nr:hypothetical protein [Longimicrobium sp.]